MSKYLHLRLRGGSLLLEFILSPELKYWKLYQNLTFYYAIKHTFACLSEGIYLGRNVPTNPEWIFCSARIQLYETVVSRNFEHSQSH